MNDNFQLLQFKNKSTKSLKRRTRRHKEVQEDSSRFQSSEREGQGDGPTPQFQSLIVDQTANTVTAEGNIGRSPTKRDKYKPSWLQPVPAVANVEGAIRPTELLLGQLRGMFIAICG